jgi:cysteine synthase
MVGALHIAERLADDNQPAVIVTLFPDGAAKYLSEPFWTQP